MKRPKPSTRTRKTLDRLEMFYFAGSVSLNRHPDRLPYGSVEREAAAHAMNGETLRKARAFADPGRGLTEKQFKSLISRCETHDYALGPSTAMLLITVPKPDRPGILTNMIRDQWSKSELRRELTRRYGRRKQTARTPVPPSNPEQAMVELLGLCGTFRRWHAVMDPDVSDAADAEVWKATPLAVRRRLREAAAAMRRLEVGAEKTMEQERRGDEDS